MLGLLMLSVNAHTSSRLLELVFLCAFYQAIVILFHVLYIVLLIFTIEAYIFISKMSRIGEMYADHEVMPKCIHVLPD